MIFKAAATALGGLIKADYCAINRYEDDRTMSIVTFWNAAGTPDIGPPFGGRWTLGDDTPSAAVLQNHRPSSRASATIRSDIGGWHRKHRIGHVVACPIVVDDRLWGTMTALYLGAEPPEEETEDRMGEFVDLVNCAITQAKTRGELISSRARLVTSADATRRRIERDLHDGPQQHLVSLALRLRDTEHLVPSEEHEIRQRLSDAIQDLTDTIDELRDLSVGLRPPSLTTRGLAVALEQLVSRSPVPVTLSIDGDRRLPEDLEVTLFYVASESLTNVLKHAHASEVRIDLHRDGTKVCLTVRDDGIGGADPALGSGLAGLQDRVEALGGTLQILSPIGQGTSVLATIG